MHAATCLQAANMKRYYINMVIGILVAGGCVVNLSHPDINMLLLSFSIHWSPKHRLLATLI